MTYTVRATAAGGLRAAGAAGTSRCRGLFAFERLGWRICNDGGRDENLSGKLEPGADRSDRGVPRFAFDQGPSSPLRRHGGFCIQLRRFSCGVNLTEGTAGHSRAMVR
jgi:hypothetical protein